MNESGGDLPPTPHSPRFEPKKILARMQQRNQELNHYQPGFKSNFLFRIRVQLPTENAEYSQEKQNGIPQKGKRIRRPQDLTCRQEIREGPFDGRALKDRRRSVKRSGEKGLKSLINRDRVLRLRWCSAFLLLVLYISKNTLHYTIFSI